MEPLVETGEVIVVPEPIGEVMLGDKDPKTLSKEEFQKSPDLLFHGAGQEFTFTHDFDYATFKNPHSQKAGDGFYTTDTRKQAELFSEKFGAKEELIVVEMLPYQARMFDFRTQDKQRNAPVPIPMLRNYSDYVSNYIEKELGKSEEEYVDKLIPPKPPEVEEANSVPELDAYFAPVTKKYPYEENVRSRRASYWKEMQYYRDRMRLVSNEGAHEDLRDLMSYRPKDGENSEFASGVFTKFMLEQGYDGIIYREGGDHFLQRKSGSEYKNPVSIIFYNIKKIGTYETWHSD